MSRKLSSMALLCVTGCARISNTQELATIRQAESVASEWALVNAQSRQGQLSDIYVEQLRHSAREQLGRLATTLAEPASPQAGEIRKLLDLSIAAEPDTILSHVDRLKNIESGLESA